MSLQPCKTVVKKPKLQPACCMALLILTALASIPAGSSTTTVDESGIQKPDARAAGILSSSRLGIHLIRSYTPGAQRIIMAHPRVLKILGLSAPMLTAAHDYKAETPRGIVVLRVFTSIQYTAAQDPARSAQDFWQRVLRGPLEALSPEDRRLIDFVEGPNEGDNTPCWTTVQDAQWFCRFWIALAPLIHAAGFRPCIGSIPVGNPPGSPEEVKAKLIAFVPAMRLARIEGGAWSYHAYSIEYTRDVAKEIWYSLRYRQFYDLLSHKYPDLARLPLILTEGGVDQSGNPVTSGWAARGTATDYARWLAWFDSEIKKDPDVLGCTLFEIGDPHGWSSFDLEPIAGWLAEYIKRTAR